jgi:GWxTD domain-containing protein
VTPALRRRTHIPLVILLSAACLGGGLITGCRGPRYDPRLPGSARSWVEGPVRWLVLPEEARHFRRLDSSAEALAFIEEFWGRRDPTPQSPGNPFTQRFFERVQAADLLYDEVGVRGALTDRGRALILLGSPSILRYTQQPAPSWAAGESRGRVSAGTDRVRVEVWGYVPEDLSPRLAEKLREAGHDFPVEITFVEGVERTRLIEGEEILETAALAAVRNP